MRVALFDPAEQLVRWRQKLWWRHTDENIDLNSAAQPIPKLSMHLRWAHLERTTRIWDPRKLFTNASGFSNFFD